MYPLPRENITVICICGLLKRTGNFETGRLGIVPHKERKSRNYKRQEKKKWILLSILGISLVILSSEVLRLKICNKMSV